MSERVVVLSREEEEAESLIDYEEAPSFMAIIYIFMMVGGFVYGLLSGVYLGLIIGFVGLILLIRQGMKQRKNILGVREEGRQRLREIDNS